MLAHPGVEPLYGNRDLSFELAPRRQLPVGLRPVQRTGAVPALRVLRPGLRRHVRRQPTADVELGLAVDRANRHFEQLDARVGDGRAEFPGRARVRLEGEDARMREELRKI